MNKTLVPECMSVIYILYEHRNDGPVFRRIIPCVSHLSLIADYVEFW